jgi:ribosomal protein S18 acetylase RimI-like enzyme
VATAALTSCSTRSPILPSGARGKRLLLEVAESNVRAARCYRSYGFVETGRRRLMDRDPSITEIELAYPLPD